MSPIFLVAKYSSPTTSPFFHRIFAAQLCYQPPFCQDHMCSYCDPGPSFPHETIFSNKVYLPVLTATRKKKSAKEP